jgi:hypothetical protein
MDCIGELSMTVGVYGIFDSETDECLYVGQSKNIEERWKGHLKTLRSGKHIRKDFVAWFDAHDRDSDSMRFEILEICADDDVIKNLVEIEWFQKLTPRFFGKMPTINERWTLSEETKAKISATVSANNPRKMYGFICKGCGGEFSTTRPGRLFCDLNCRRKYDKIILADEALRSELIEKYEIQKMTLHEIARQMNVSHVTVYNLLDNFGIPRRGRSKAGIVNEYIPVFTFLDNSNTKAKAAKVAAHNRWHKSRGIINDSCEICKVETTTLPEIA